MSSVSKYIEAKKLYYTELFNLAQLTMREKMIRDVALSLSENINGWLDETKLSQDQVRLLHSLLIRFIDYFSHIDQNSQTTGDELIVNGLDEPDIDNADEDDINETIRCISKILGIEVINIPNFFISVATLWGCIQPYVRLYEYVILKKKEFVDELSKAGRTIDIIQEMKAIVFSGEDPDLVKDCLGDLSVDMGGKRDDFDIVADLYDNSYHVKMAINNNVKVISDGLSDDLDDKIQPVSSQCYYWIDKLLLNIAEFKMGHDFLSDKLSEKEKEAFDLILNQPFIASRIDEIISKTIAQQPQTTVEEGAFTLPDNYFSELKTSSNKEEFLTRTFFTAQTDVSRFIELINYMADRGYIENNLATKQLLAFRLTGRLRPNGVLPKIKWMGKASRGADCLYLMKWTDAKYKYIKMREFFDADFPETKCSNLVFSAGTEFMKKLNYLFPDIYNLPKRL